MHTPSSEVLAVTRLSAPWHSYVCIDLGINTHIILKGREALERRIGT